MSAGIVLAPTATFSPLTCDECGRFVSRKDASFSHEYGDYGTILSTEVLCPRCDATHTFCRDIAVSGPST